jgi:hypothetical protein
MSFTPSSGKPAAVDVPVAGCLADLSRQASYRRAKDGTLPVIALGGRKKVSVARLELLIGRPISAEEIATAVEKVKAANKQK